MSRILAICAILIGTAFDPPISFARCASFGASTMDVGDVPKARWRTDYPASVTNVSMPWQSIDFRVEPQGYLRAVLETVKPHIRRDGRKLVGTTSEQWWISLWLDYTASGREPFMGLTKERGPESGDLSPTNVEGHQVWAVGFYNAPGATILGKVFADPCNPQLPQSLNFPEGTVSVKFLFTDASTDEVTYLRDGPEYDANIDRAGSGSQGRPVAQRQKRSVRLLQVDISVKDRRAVETVWVFGTFGWVGPPKGDGLYDNLVPVSLQWGNDPGVVTTTLAQSWTNPDLRNVMYGWAKRPTLGFNGRANGPADNIRSSCLSCHAAARSPRSSKGLLGFRFDMDNDITDQDKLRAHVDTWFGNLKGGDLFDPTEPAVSALDYSLQLDAAIFRMCRACQNGDLTGPTPGICRAAKVFDEPSCRTQLDARVAAPSMQQLEEERPPRQ
jgi:hypothetical protein